MVVDGVIRGGKGGKAPYPLPLALHFTSLAFYNKAAGKVAAQDNQIEKEQKNRHLAVAERSGVNENKK